MSHSIGGVLHAGHGLGGSIGKSFEIHGGGNIGGSIGGSHGGSSSSSSASAQASAAASSRVSNTLPIIHKFTKLKFVPSVYL